MKSSKSPSAVYLQCLSALFILLFLLAGQDGEQGVQAIFLLLAGLFWWRSHWAEKKTGSSMNCPSWLWRGWSRWHWGV